MHNISVHHLCKRVIKYILEGLVVAIACLILPRQKVDMEAVICLALIASATFAILDLFSSDIGNAARWGTGLSIGTNLAGGIHLN